MQEEVKPAPAPVILAGEPAPFPPEEIRSSGSFSLPTFGGSTE